MKLTNKDLETMEFRQEKLKEKLKEIENILSGRDNSIVPFITSDTGEYSEERTWQFINNLIDALDEYGLAKELWYDYSTDEYLESIPETMKEYMECYLYCMLRVMHSDLRWMYDLVVDLPEMNFNQLIQTAKEERVGEDKYSLLFEETYYGIAGLGGIFQYADAMYEELSGQSIHKTIPEDLRKKMEELYASWIAEYMKDLESLEPPEDIDSDELAEMTDEELQVYSQEQYEEWYNSLTEDEKLVVEKDSEFSEEMNSIRNRWKNEFTYKEVFCDKYLRYRELYFQELPYYQTVFDKLVAGMVDIYLCKSGLSAYMDEELFITSFTHLRKTTAVIKKMREGE